MIRKIYLFVLMAVILSACETPEKSTKSENPFFAEYTTPYGIPPFEFD